MCSIACVDGHSHVVHPLWSIGQSDLLGHEVPKGLLLASLLEA